MKKISLKSQFCEEFFSSSRSYPDEDRIASGIADQLKGLGWEVEKIEAGDAYTFGKYRINPPKDFFFVGNHA